MKNNKKKKKKIENKEKFDKVLETLLNTPPEPKKEEKHNKVEYMNEKRSKRK